jgi:hypothetical protein
MTPFSKNARGRRWACRQQAPQGRLAPYRGTVDKRIKLEEAETLLNELPA